MKEIKKSIVFLLPGTDHRKGVINGNTIRYGNVPCSGTDSSVIFIAEYLSEKNFEVTVVLDKTDGRTVNGVNYTDFSYNGLSNNIDILVVCLWFADKSGSFHPFEKDYEGLPFKVNESLIYWQHLPWMYGFREIENFLIKNNNISFGLVSPSVWAQGHVSYVYDKNSRLHQVCRLVHNTVIANPLSVELFEEIEAENEYILKKPKSSIFHSQYNRGGAITEKAIQELSWPNTEFLCYLGGEGLGRKQLYKKLLETEYFIFPIYNRGNKMLLKDTFCCAVAEAMAAGVITITYPVGGIKEYFGDGCVFLNFPPNTDIESMYRDWATMDAEYMEYTENIKNTLLLIENNPTLKDNIRQKAKQISRSRLNIPRIGKEWENFIYILTERGHT